MKGKRNVFISFLNGKVAFLVTSNIHKFNEARRVLSDYKIALAMLQKIVPVEIQDDRIENIANAAALDAARKSGLPIIVTEDTGLFIKALNSFPGPYSSYVYRTIGNDGVLELMEDETDRKSYFKSAVAFLGSTMNEPLCFVGKTEGKIVEEKRGGQGFGFDPIFEPLNSTRTFAEMTVDEKNQHSHRASAFRKFGEWYAQFSRG